MSKQLKKKPNRKKVPTSKNPKKPFHHSGIRFQCQGTGNCCVSRGSYGYVYMSLEDRRRMSKEMGLSTAVFTKKYCEQTDGEFHLKGGETKDCIFLKNARCQVYAGRPWQCRTWPFWPENMNAKTWTSISKNCPGIGKGRRYSKKEIDTILAEDPLS